MLIRNNRFFLDKITNSPLTTNRLNIGYLTKKSSTRSGRFGRVLYQSGGEGALAHDILLLAVQRSRETAETRPPIPGECSPPSWTQDIVAITAVRRAVVSWKMRLNEWVVSFLLFCLAILGCWLITMYWHTCGYEPYRVLSSLVRRSGLGRFWGGGRVPGGPTTRGADDVEAFAFLSDITRWWMR